MDAALRHSPIDAAHRALGARFAPFGGWEMPIQYSGVLEEHRACRKAAVVFDVSHLGTLRCAGPGSVAMLQWALTNDLHRIQPGHAQYTHLLDEHDASVVDDLIVWWLGENELLVMPNASNTEPLVTALRDATARFGSRSDTIDDVTAGRAVLAVQGPEARHLLAPLAPEAAAVARFAVQPFEWRGIACVAAGTGYTGEDGVEIHVPAPVAREVWDALLGAGIPPAGLGARDTLRLEAGLPLHGHELGPGITPLQAGLGWVVRWDKGDFRGARRSKPRRSAASRAGYAASRSTGASRRGRAPQCAKTVSRWGRSRAGTSHLPSSTASRSASCAPTSSPAPTSRSTYAVAHSPRASSPCRS